MTPRRHGTRLTDERLVFEFDGRTVEALRGDSLASALLADGIRLVGRSLKYRRARGVYSAGPEEPNALVTVGRQPRAIPNVSAPMLSVSPGLEAFSQNRWPGLRWNVSSLLSLGSGFLGAGFYYKTFMWPSWRAYEGLIRRLAGLGEAPHASDLAPTKIEYLDTDLLVVGAGPAGLSAALAAARGGARVILCERESHCGGELEFETARFDGQSARQWIARTLHELAQRGARVLTETTVVAGSGRHLFAHRHPGGLPGGDSMLRLRARAVIAATGAVEYPIAFRNNDLPGVMLLGAAERYLSRYGVRVGHTAVLFGTHDRLYAAAKRLLAGGIRVPLIIDSRTVAQAGSSEQARAELRKAGVECLLEHGVLSAHGRLGLRAITIAPRGTSQAERIVRCDALLLSGGWSPCSYARLMSEQVCGAAAGHLEISDLVTAAYEAGRRVLPGATPSGLVPVARGGDPAPRGVPLWRVAARGADEKYQFIDLQNDVTVADLRQALDEGFHNAEHIKRYTTLGVGTEQGRISRYLGAAIAADLLQSRTEPAPSRSRPPYQPIPLLALCGTHVGDGLRPERRTPLHEWHSQHGGVLEAFGLWLRPRYYGANGAEPLSAGITEARRVRSVGGVLDASTLGKIEIAGPGADAFLNRICLTPASRLETGRARYAVMLREDGMVLDDGIVLRLAADHLLATVSSSHAQLVLAHLEYWRDCEGWRPTVTVTEVTDAWAVIVVAGPVSRDALHTALGSDWRNALDTLEHMAFTAGEWQGRGVRVLRASYSGELAYEVHCRPTIALRLWEALVAAGLNPFGLEALDILRVEKGYLGGPEINGQTTPRDLGLEKMLTPGKACVGREALERVAFADPDRPRLVGLQSVQPEAVFHAGAHLAALEAPARSLGHVTSAVYSPSLSRWIGLALLAGRSAHIGESLLAADPLRGSNVPVTVGPTVHFDRRGERMKA